MADRVAAYEDALPRYVAAFETAFARARARSEFEFIQCLLRIRGEADGGWDPYETTVSATEALVKLQAIAPDPVAARHLQLWIYGHVVEAAEPYELLANLIDVAQGGEYVVDRFSRGAAGRRGTPATPAQRISKIRQAAIAAEMPVVAEPFGEFWNGELRDAIFRGDYGFTGAELRTLHPLRTYSRDEELRFVGRALAYHDALATLNRRAMRGYDASVKIPVPIEFSEDREEQATVMVKEGRGVIGLKDSWTDDELATGRLPWLIARLTPEDAALLREDRTRAAFPADKTRG